MYLYMHITWVRGCGSRMSYWKNDSFLARLTQKNNFYQVVKNNLLILLHFLLLSNWYCISFLYVTWHKSCISKFHAKMKNRSIYFFMVIFGTILATILVSIFWQWGASKSWTVNNLTLIKVGTEIAYYYYVYV